MKDLSLDTLSREVSERTNLSISEAKEALKTTVEIVKETIKNGKTVRIRGFGKFAPKVDKERKRYNFQTERTVVTPPKNNIAFKPSKNLKDYLNK